MLQVIVMGQLALYALNVQVCVAGDPVPVYEYDIDVDDSTAVRVANEHGIQTVIASVQLADTEPSVTLIVKLYVPAVTDTGLGMLICVGAESLSNVIELRPVEGAPEIGMML